MGFSFFPDQPGLSLPEQRIRNATRELWYLCVDPQKRPTLDQHLSQVEKLLAQGADVNLKGAYGHNLLAFLFAGDLAPPPPVLDLLLSHGANPIPHALQAAIKRPGAKSHAAAETLVRACLRHGHQTPDGMSVLRCIARAPLREYSVDLLRMALDGGARVNDPADRQVFRDILYNEHGWQPAYMRATEASAPQDEKLCAQRAWKMVEVLLDAGCNPSLGEKYYTGLDAILRRLGSEFPDPEDPALVSKIAAAKLHADPGKTALSTRAPRL